MKSLTSLLVVLCSATASFALVEATGGGGLLATELNPQNITSLAVIFFIVRWQLTNLEAKDKAFADLVGKFVDTIKEKDVRYTEMIKEKDTRYETMVQECRESSDRILRRLLEMEVGKLDQ